MFSYKNVHQQVNIFHKTLINIYIYSNFVLNMLVTFDNRDTPWMAGKLEEKVKLRHKFYRDYLKNGQTQAGYIYHSML